MSKVQISISLSIDHITVLHDVIRRYKLKSNGEAVETIINQWHRLIEATQKEIQKRKEEEKTGVSKPPINPFVNP